MSVTVPAGKGSWAENKNGMPNITKLSVWDSDDGNGPCVYFDLIGENDRALRGGIRMGKEEFLTLCRKSLETWG